jgi:hypothetical protein
MTEPLKPVPSAASTTTTIEPQLRAIVLKIYDDQPIQVDVQVIQQYLQDRAALISAGKLDTAYDWAGDLKISETHFKVAIDWLPHHREVRDGFIKYWRDRTERGSKTVVDMSLNGMKTLMLLHGAVALGALNLLSDKDAAISNISAAKFGLAFSLFGIMMLGLGQVIAIAVASKLNGTISGKLSTKLPWRKIRAMGRYWRRGFKIMFWADDLIYGSVLWFGIYTTILCIMLVST